MNYSINEFLKQLFDQSLNNKSHQINHSTNDCQQNGNSVLQSPSHSYLIDGSLCFSIWGGANDQTPAPGGTIRERCEVQLHTVRELGRGRVSVWAVCGEIITYSTLVLQLAYINEHKLRDFRNKQLNQIVVGVRTY